MTNPLFALILYSLWTLALLCLALSIRSFSVLSGRARANAFPPYDYDPSRFHDRVSRAYQNCLELLPVFAVLVFTAELIGLPALAGVVAIWIPVLRILQGLVHMAGAGHWLVLLRFHFFLGQVIVLAWLAWQLAVTI